MSYSRGARLLVAAIIIGSAAACAGGTAQRGFFIGQRGEAEDRDIRIEVVNDNYADMTIYVVRESANLRLGDVTAKTSKEFTLNPNRISPARGLSLLADPIGSRGAYISAAVSAGSGSMVILNLSPDLAQSYITLR